MNKVWLFLLLMMISISISAQHGGQHGGQHKGSKYRSGIEGEIFGKVIDFNSKAPMEYATVSLFSTDGKLITGAITDEKGVFDLTKITGGKYKLSVSYIGFSVYTMDDIIIGKRKSVYNIGDIVLTSSNVLDEVVIDGTTPNIRYEIDKKIIDVSQLNADLAQSAIEILENIPSIAINDDGMVSLRGSSSFTLLIDGKPTAMEASDALASIPASMIKNIELITNPSAKYDAEGVGGIINIVLKQNKLKGVSLLTNLSAGTFSNFGGDLAVNFREAKYGINLTASHNNRTRPRTRTTDRTRNAIGYQSRIHSDESNNGKMIRSKISGEFIYEPNTLHTIIIGGTYNTFGMHSDNDIEYYIYRNDNLHDSYKNIEIGLRDFVSKNANLTYRYNIGRNKSHYLEFKSIFSSWNGEELLITDYNDFSGNKFGGTKRTETGPSSVLRFNIDYSRKIGAAKFETGVQYQHGYSADDSDNYEYNQETDSYDHLPLYSKDVSYNRDIAAIYSLYASHYHKVGYQLGLRLEHTDRNISATNSEKFTSINRFDLFPSAHISYKLTNKQDLLFNYSRRINRPRSYYFEPFITWYSAYDIASGNPNLKPEYIDAFEVNWVNNFNSKGNISLELYFRNIKNLIERTETIYKDDILIRLPINIGKAISTGLTVSTSYKVLKWWKADLSINAYQYNINGEINNKSYTRSSFNWNGRWNNSFPLKNDWNLQFTTNYNSKTTTIQGYQESYISFNSSIKKSFLNGKYAFTLQGRNIFGTRKNDSYIITDGLSVHSLRIPKSPSINLTFSMRLNNYKSSSRKVEVNDI